MRFKFIRAGKTFGLTFLVFFLVLGGSSRGARLDTEGRPSLPDNQSTQEPSTGPVEKPVTKGTSTSSSPLTHPSPPEGGEVKVRGKNEIPMPSSSQPGVQPEAPRQPEGKSVIPSRPVIRSTGTGQSAQTSQTPGSGAQGGVQSGAAAAAPPAPPGGASGPLSPAGLSPRAQQTSPLKPGVAAPAVPPAPAAPPTPAQPAGQTPPGQRSQQLPGPERRSGISQEAVTAQVKEEAAKTTQAAKTEEDKEKVSIDFDDVDVRVIIKFISETTGQNFLLDDKVKGKVTIISPKKIPLKDVTQVFLSILEIQGFSTVRVGEVIKILPAREVTQRGIETKVGKEVGKIPIQDRVVTQLVPLSYADVNEIKTLLTPMISKNSTIVSYPPTNTLIITETQSNLNRLVTIVTELDIPSEDEEISVIPVIFATAEDMAKIINEVMEIKAAPRGVTPTVIRRRGVTARTTAIQAVEEVLKIIPEPRTNVLIVVATPDKTARVKALVAQIDIERPRREGNFHVIYLENADAEELMSTLSSVAEKATRATVSGAVAPGAPAAVPPRPGETGPPGLAIGAVEFKGKVKIAADKPTNALIINADPEDFQILKELIDKLDIRRLQVYVETAIMEISTTAANKLGLDFIVGSEVGDDGAVFFGESTEAFRKFIAGLLTGNPFSSLSDGLVLGGAGGTIQVPTATGTPTTIFGAIALARAIESKTQANILATPHLLTMDNEEAEIVIADTVPFLTSSSQTTGGNIIQNIDRRDVGITLRFTPTVNASNTIKLKIFQEVSNVTATTALAGISAESVGPTTQKRTTKSTLVVQNNQTIVIGGLMRDDVNASRNKVPCLGDIPGLGLLFRNASKDDRKTNLLIFITPRVIRTDQDIAEVTHRKEKFMEEFKEKQGVEEEKPEPKGFFKNLQRNKEFLEKW